MTGVQIVSGERIRSRSSILERSKRAANGFRALGVGARDTIALILRNDFAFFEATFAANALGASPVSVNWHLAEPEIAFILEDCRAKAVVIHADLLNAFGEAIPEGMKVLTVDTPEEVREAYRLEKPVVTSNSDHEPWDHWLSRFEPLNEETPNFTDTMIYTSGTTGKPKGVRRYPLEPQMAKEFFRIRDQIYGIEPGMRALVCGPLYHGAPNSFGMRSVKVGETVVLMPRFNARDFLRLVEKYKITNAFMVPTMFVRLLKLSDEERGQYDISSLKNVVTAAAHCPVAVKQAMCDWFGPIVNEFFAATEVSYVSYCTAAESLAKPGTVGKILDEVRLRILDENGDVLPTGKTGEIYTKLRCGPEFTYENNKAARNALETDGLIATGDMGYLDDDGYLFLRDRRRDMVISGGVNIYPAEIEAELLKLKEVKDCAVFGVSDDEYGERLIATVQLEPGQALTQTDIITHLMTRLAGFKVPRTIDFRDSLPRDDAGKIYKRQLRDEYANTRYTGPKEAV